MISSLSSGAVSSPDVVVVFAVLVFWHCGWRCWQWDSDLPCLNPLTPHTWHQSPLRTDTHTVCGDGCSSGHCIACCWLSKSSSAQINNRAKEAFSCRSTPSAPNTEVDDSAVSCPLSAVDTGVEQAHPVGATCVKAWNSVPGPLWQFTSSCALYSHCQSHGTRHTHTHIY